MEDRNRDNEQHIKVLQRLLSIVDEQGKTDEYAEALREAIKTLGGDDQGEAKQDGLRLSGTPADQLLQLAQQVRDKTLSPTQRTAAASRLVRMGGGR